MAASAAYAIASGAGEIVTTETGVSGSIGVLYIHADVSCWRGRREADPDRRGAQGGRQPFAPLPDTVKADFQRDVDAVQTIFVMAVAAGRGARLTADQARARDLRTDVHGRGCRQGRARRSRRHVRKRARRAGEGAVSAAPRPAPASAARPSVTVATPRAAPVAAKPDDPITAARRAEWTASVALCGLWPDFAAYAGFCRDAETAALARRGTP